MDTKKIAYLLAFLLVFLSWSTPDTASAATGDTRYLVKSNSTFWKNSFGVRHQFDGGFSADLSDLQVRMAKLFGLKLEPVKKMFILTTDDSKTLAQENISRGSRKTQTNAGPPIDQIPWGIERVYGDPYLTSTTGGKDVKIAVLDTGIFTAHPDLDDRILGCKDFTAPRGIVEGKCEDKNGHGTHVSGIIAADGGPDGKGIYGVAPEASLVIYRVCGNDGACWADDIAAAIEAAANDGVNIINMSLGGDSDIPFLAQAIDKAVAKHVLVIAAAGNDGPYDGTMDYPAAYASVIGVGAMDVGYLVPEWSSRGDNFNTEPDVIEEGDIEFAAPGVNIESTWKDGGYVILSGTSMAAPHITGLAAKLWQFDNDDADNNVRSVLKSLTIDIDEDYEDNASGYGMPGL